MGDYIHRIARLYDVNERIPRIRTRLPLFRDEDFSDEAFFQRFRFTKDGFNHLRNLLADDLLEAENNRGHPIPPKTQLLVALRYYATGSFQIVHGICKVCRSHGLPESSRPFQLQSLVNVLEIFDSQLERKQPKPKENSTKCMDFRMYLVVSMVFMCQSKRQVWMNVRFTDVGRALCR